MYIYISIFYYWLDGNVVLSIDNLSSACASRLNDLSGCVFCGMEAELGNSECS